MFVKEGGISLLFFSNLYIWSVILVNKFEVSKASVAEQSFAVNYSLGFFNGTDKNKPAFT